MHSCNIIILSRKLSGFQNSFSDFYVSEDYHRKRQRDDDRPYGRDNSRRNSDHESRRDSDHDMRPVNNTTILFFTNKPFV